MNIIKAKTAGFCFGVDRGVKMTYDLLEKGHKVATLGPLIHNDQLVADLEAKQVTVTGNADSAALRQAIVDAGYEVVE